MPKIPDTVKNFIGGRFVSSAGTRKRDIVSPLDARVISCVELSGGEDLKMAVSAAKTAFLKWSAQIMKERAQIFYRYKQLLQDNLQDLSEIIRLEHGKTIEEAAAEVEKGIEVTEFACSLPQIVSGEGLEVSKGIYCHYDRVPLGVVSSIVPFNFPIMVPHWTIPISIMLGNCFILKPSEQVPISSARIAQLLKDAGLPDGVFNTVNGDREIVEAVCDHHDIKAVSFVGSTAVAKAVYQRATANFKRALCLGGAKNHCFLLPDADPAMSAKNIAASFIGCTGQRCMALSVLLAVGPVDDKIAQICAEAEKFIPGKNLGPVISGAAKERILGYIDSAEREGARIILDGRKAKNEGDQNGYYLGPTIIDNVTPSMKVAQEEIFGPVLSIIRVKNIHEGIAIENAHPCGNAASVFTQNGSMAEEIIKKISAGMTGVNIGVPVPREPFAFGGWNDSKFGAGDITGKSSINFWTQDKKITVKWNPQAGHDWMS